MGYPDDAPCIARKNNVSGRALEGSGVLWWILVSSDRLSNGYPMDYQPDHRV
jgi:hypothetical protein